MYPISLVECSLECDSLEEERHQHEIILSRQSREYRLILFPIFIPEIAWSLHPSEEYRDFFGFDLFDDGSDISLDISGFFSLECIIAPDAEDRESWCPSLQEPVHTRE